MGRPGPDGDIDSEAYADTSVDPGADGPAAGHSRPRWGAAALVAGLAVAAVLAGGLVPGLVLRPLPDPAPTAGLLDREGYGAVRLGQSFTDCRSAGGPGGPCGGSTNSVAAVDSEHRCTLYEGEEQAAGVVSVWTRDGTVVVIRVTGQPAAGGLRTWPGPALGQSLDPRPPDLDRFEADHRTSRLDYRLQVNDVVTTLTDTDGDGRLDRAEVAIPEGLACRPDRPSSAA